MLYIFDKDDNLLEIIEDYSNDELTRDIKGTFTFSFKYEVNATENIKKRNKVGFFIDDEKKDNFRLFIIDEVEECYFNDEELYVYCINDYYSLKDNVIIDKRCNNYNVDQTLEKVLENTSYVLGDTINLGTESLNFYYVSSLEAFNNTRETYGFEFDTRIEFNEDYTKIDYKYIDIKYRLGQDTGLRFTYDTNLTKVKRTISSENHYNVLYGRGSSLETDEGGYTRLLDFADVSDTDKNKPLGQKYVEDINSIAKYGRIEGIYENKDIKDATELLNATWNKLQETKEPQVTYEAEAEDIRDIEGFEHYNANLGDSIIILDEDYKLDYESRIIKDVMSIKDKTHKITLGYILPSMTDSIGGIVVNSSDKENIKVNDTNFPNTLPPTPILSMDNEGFATLSLSWTFENKSYYTYILYASKLENFNPTEDDIIWQGQGSSFLHEVNFNETWYYRIRAKNTHNQYTEFSNQVTGTTYKISDATEVFEEAAIKDALIGNLNADRAWVGKFKGDTIDAKNLSVTDGNGKKTFEVDSFGNVSLDVTQLKIQNEDVATSSELQQTSKDLQLKFSESGYNLLYNGDFKRQLEKWYPYGEGITYGDKLSCPNGRGVRIQGAIGQTRRIRQTIEYDNSNETITLSFYIHTSSIGEDGTTNPFRQAQIQVIYEDDTNMYNLVDTQTVFDKWEKISYTLVPEKRIKSIVLDLYVRDTSKIIHFSSVMIHKGSIAKEFSPNPNETYDGIVTIDKDGVKVDSSDISSHTLMSKNGFEIVDEIKNRKIFSVKNNRTLDMVGTVTIYDNSGNKSGYLGYNSLDLYNWVTNTDEVSATFAMIKDNDTGAQRAGVFGKHAFTLGKMTETGALKSVIECTATPTVHFLADAVMNNYDINNVDNITAFSINKEVSDSPLYVNQLHLRGNAVNPNIVGNRLYLNYWKGYNSDTTNTTVRVCDGNNDGSWGILYCGDFKAYGTKNCIVETDYGHIGINAYETAECYFGDIGETVLDDEGYSYVYIDSIFAQTVNTNRKYQVFLTVYGEGVANVIERHPTYFIIKGTPGIEIGYEIKAKRKGYEDNRLEREANTFVKGEDHGLDEDYKAERETFTYEIEEKINETNEEIFKVEDLLYSINSYKNNLFKYQEDLKNNVESYVNDSIENKKLLDMVEESVLDESIN